MKKVQYRIVFFLFLTFAAFFAGILLLRYSEQQQITDAVSGIKYDKQIMLKKILSLQGKGLETYAYDYSLWDETLLFLKSRDEKWAYLNIESTMPTFNINYVWLYDRNFSLVYSRNTFHDKLLKGIPLEDETLREQLTKNRFSHFFIRTSVGLTEIRTAPIQPGQDLKRTSDPGGYIICGKVWSDDYIAELSQLLSAKVSIEPASENSAASESYGQALVVNRQLLPGPGNTQAAVLQCTTHSDILRQLGKSSQTLLTLSILFGAFIVIACFYFLISIISQPLKLITNSLEAENPELIKELTGIDNEFGSLARLITRFFEQKQELKKAKTAAENADKAKSVFMGNLSHEIRTSMNTILGFSELLRYKVFDPKAQEFLSGVISSGKNLMKVINEILDYSKIDTGKITISNKPCLLSRISSEIENVYGPVLEKKNVAFRTNIDSIRKKNILFDEIHLRQVLFILTGNAVKYTESGHVEISFALSCGNESLADLKITVADTGIGIPEDQQTDIFQAFRPRGNTHPAEFGAPGLGLATARKLVEMMNGTISLESHPMQGTVFTLYFPNVEMIPEVHHGTGLTNTAAPAGNMTAACNIPDELKFKLSGSLYRQYETMKAGMMIDEIMEFAKEIRQTGNRFDNERLIRFGDELYRSADSFKVTNIERLFTEFPGLVDELTR